MMAASSRASRPLLRAPGVAAPEAPSLLSLPDPCLANILARLEVKER